MKVFSSIVLIILIGMLSGCSGSTGPQTTMIFRADLDSVHWLPVTKIIGTWDPYVPMAHAILIEGINDKQEGIMFMFNSDTIPPGTYYCDTSAHPPFISASCSRIPNFTAYPWISGSVTLEELTTSHAKGTFHFKAASSFLKDTLDITNGFFDVDLTKGRIVF